MASSDQVDILASMRQFADAFDQRMEQLLSHTHHVPPTLAEAVRYSLLGPGKRLRPFLVYTCCGISGGNDDDAFPAAAAIEMVHTFSLVHDDLPAMDDDDLRRGRPTCHKMFGEALAILTGDALLALAFETLVRHVSDARNAAAMVAELADGSGWAGMIGGQVADLQGEKEPPDLQRTKYIHERKTAALLATSCKLGGLAGNADASVMQSLGNFGTSLGLAFQIADDLLDVTATAMQIGKNVGKDASAGKQTYPACVGVQESKLLALRYVDEALGFLSDFGSEADPLRHVARFTVSRTT